MRKRICRTLMVITLCGSLWIPPAAAKIQDAIVAVINDDVITVSDLHDYMNALYQRLLSAGRSQQEIQNILQEYQSKGVEKLIENKLILSKANEMKVQVREEAVDDRVKEIKEKYPSEQDFLDALVKDGNNITDLRNKIKNQMKIQWMIEDQVKSKVHVSPTEVSDFYEKHPELFRKPARITLESIFVSLGDKEKKDAQEKIETAVTMLKDSSFEDVAAKFSEAPSPGTVRKGTMLKKIEDTVWALDEGGVSAPLEMDNGIYIFKVIKKFPAETATLEETKENIKARLFQIKFNDRLQDWLSELKKNAYIEIKNPSQGPIL